MTRRRVEGRVLRWTPRAGMSSGWWFLPTPAPNDPHAGKVHLMGDQCWRVAPFR